MEWHYQLFVILVIGFVLFIGYGTYATATVEAVAAGSELAAHARRERSAAGDDCLLRGVGLYLSHLSPAQLGWQMPDVSRQIWVGILTGMGVAYFFYYVTRLIVNRTGERFYSSSVIGYILPRNNDEFWLVLMALIPVVLLEELLFRSLLWVGLLRWRRYGYC
ncbi:MAG: hypothetical protein R2856_11155 [Caldilineaceae bacterium]